MALTDRVDARCESGITEHVQEIADATGLDESEVIRRLLRLGIQDVDEVGYELLLGAGEPIENTTPAA